jgi:hypothetical protein
MMTQSGHTACAEQLPDSVKSIYGETNRAQDAALSGASL